MSQTPWHTPKDWKPNQRAFAAVFFVVWDYAALPLILHTHLCAGWTQGRDSTRRLPIWRVLLIDWSVSISTRTSNVKWTYHSYYWSWNYQALNVNRLVSLIGSYYLKGNKACVHLPFMNVHAWWTALLAMSKMFSTCHLCWEDTAIGILDNEIHTVSVHVRE